MALEVPSVPLKPKESVTNDVHYQNPSSKIESIRNDERVSEMREHLNGKSFSNTETIQFLYPDKLYKKQEVKFNIGEQSIDI